MFWRKDSSEENINRMNEVLKKSFSNVKKDTENIFKWLNFFYRKSLEQEQAIKGLQLELSQMPRTREDIRRIIDDYYSYEGIMARVRELGIKVSELERKQVVQAALSAPAATPPREPIHTEKKSDYSHIEKRLERLEQRKMAIRERIVKRLARNSKEYLKGIIVSYIRKYEKISALQLKEIMVDEQSYCSKSSFYRLLEEVESNDEIAVIKQGKEKQYLLKSVRKI